MGTASLDARYDETQSWPADIGADPASVVCVGTNIPTELIAAAGFRPIPLAARPMPVTPLADRRLESGFGAEHRSVMEQLLAGAADNAALVVLDRRFRDLYYYLKELVRLGKVRRLPPLHIVDFLLSRNVDCTAYNREQVRLLTAQLERVGGHSDADALASEIARANAWRASVRDLLRARRRGVVAGVPAFRALGAVRAMDQAAHQVLLDELVASLVSVEPSGLRRAALFSAESLYHDRLHRAVEEAGVLVTDEDSEWGSRLAGADVESSRESAEALLAKYWADATGRELRPFDARAAYLRSVLEVDPPDLVVINVPPADNRYGWDVPGMARLCAAAGVPVALVRSDLLTDDSATATTTVIRALDANVPGLAEDIMEEIA